MDKCLNIYFSKKEIQMAKILEKMSNILRCQGNVH